MAQVTDFAALDSALDALAAAIDTIVATAEGEIQTTGGFLVREGRAIGEAQRLARFTKRGYNAVIGLQEVT